MTDDVAWFPVASAALGWLPMQGRDWALGVEGREQLAYGSDGLQRDWALSILAQLSD